jgi:hypothetical protein
MQKRETYTEPMKQNRLISLAASAALLLIVSAAPVHAQAEQRVVYVSALDESGAPVQNLDIRDIEVREDKVAREILSVAPAADPMQIVLLVDNSQAADPIVRDLREALTTFITTIGADPSGTKHELSIVTVGERPTINTDYTTDLAKATKGAQRIFAQRGSGTYLLDGIIETSKGIMKRGSTRPVIVAIATEGPELSERVYQAVLEPLRESGAAFHLIGVGMPRNDDHDRSIVFDMGTKDSGGRYETVLAPSGLANRLKQVAIDLTHQFKVTYSRPQTLIPPEQVTVTAVKPGLTVRGTAMKPVREDRPPARDEGGQ